MIEVQSLSRYYGSRCAVDDVSFSIASNEVVGFLGLNGAGKSTTLKVLAGLLAPTSGKVLIDGVDMTTAPVSFRTHIGYLPEDTPLYKEMTVTEFLRFIGGTRGMSASEITARLPTVFTVCQLQGVEERVIDELSHGYRKRVGIAQAIIHRPKLVILDEPISGLDPVQIVKMRQVIRGLKTESTVLVSSHNLPEISQTCDRLLVLNDGALVARGSEDELAAQFHKGGAYEFELVGTPDQAVQATAAIQRLPVVQAAEARPTPSGRTVLVLELSDDTPEVVVAALVGVGVGIRRVEQTVDELEGIFLGLTKGAA